MIVTALQALDADPTFVNGGVIAQLGASSATGSDDLFVIEADESDGTFLLYDTSIALITNVDPDHLDHYGTRRRVLRRVRDVRRTGPARPSSSRPTTRARASVAERLTHPNVLTFGESDAADVRVTDIRTDGPVSFTISHDGVVGRRAAARFPARTTRSTPPARSPCCSRSGYELEPAVRAVEGFEGTVRRFELHGVERGVSVFDDYAHHPTEVAAALVRGAHRRRRRADHRDPAAAHVLAHAADVPRVRRGARAATPTTP